MWRTNMQMNKKITPLRALERIKEFYPTWRLSNRKDFKIIETALNDYFVYKQDYERVMREKNSLLKECAKNQKKLKALKIIKKKRVDVALLMSCCCYKQYCDFYIKRWKDVENIQLPTKKEYKFLKEVFKDESRR